jgi:hypothetical protein
MRALEEIGVLRLTGASNLHVNTSNLLRLEDGVQKVRFCSSPDFYLLEPDAMCCSGLILCPQIMEMSYTVR